MVVIAAQAEPYWPLASHSKLEPATINPNYEALESMVRETLSLKKKPEPYQLKFFVAADNTLINPDNCEKILRSLEAEVELPSSDSNKAQILYRLYTKEETND